MLAFVPLTSAGIFDKTSVGIVTESAEAGARQTAVYWADGPFDTFIVTVTPSLLE